MQLARVFFLTGSVFGIFLNVIVAIAMTFDKNAKNSTYRAMVQLAISDACLLAGSCIAATALYIFSTMANAPVLWLISEVIAEISMRCSECFLVLVAFTRFLQFASPALSQSIAIGNRFLVIICCIWFSAIAFYAPLLFGFEIVDVLPDNNYPYTNTTYATVIKYFDPSVAISSLVLQVAFNLTTFLYILSLRKIIVSSELKKKQRREIKLFVQCAIDSLIFVITKVLQWVCKRINGQTCPRWVIDIGMVFNFLNAADCAVLYLCFNRQLRRTMAKFVKEKLFILCKRQSSTTPVRNLAQQRTK